MRFLKKIYQEHRLLIDESFILGIMAAITFSGAIYFDAAEVFFKFSRAHEDWQVDDIVFSLLVVMSFYSAVFSIRRWMETSLLMKEADTDCLTETYNRRKCLKNLSSEVSIAAKFRKPLAVSSFDIDHFKKINDTFGHPTGDLVLKTVSGLVRNEIRSADSLFRIGGEEFIIISTETDLIGAVMLSERLRSMIEQYPFGRIGKITASFGVAEYIDGDTKESLIDKADKKLYVAKKNGRNRVES